MTKRSALRLMPELLKKQGSTPKLLVIDELRSYASAFRQLRLTCRHEQGPRHKQSGRVLVKWYEDESASFSASNRPTRPTFPEHARRGPQHSQASTPPDLPIDPADLQSRGSCAMVRRCRNCIRPDRPIPPSDPTPATVTKPPGNTCSGPAKVAWRRRTILPLGRERGDGPDGQPDHRRMTGLPQGVSRLKPLEVIRDLAGPQKAEMRGVDVAFQRLQPIASLCWAGDWSRRAREPLEYLSSAAAARLG
jgi:hypothetical protein